MARKNTSNPAESNATNPQLDELYMAHQVHTLAQHTYRHLMTGWNRMGGGAPATVAPVYPGPGPAAAWPPMANPSAQGANPATHGAQPPIVYWYP